MYQSLNLIVKRKWMSDVTKEVNYYLLSDGLMKMSKVTGNLNRVSGITHILT